MKYKTSLRYLSIRDFQRLHGVKRVRGPVLLQAGLLRRVAGGARRVLGATPDLHRRRQPQSLQCI